MERKSGGFVGRELGGGIAGWGGGVKSFFLRLTEGVRQGV